MNDELLVATRNPAKLREYRGLLHAVPLTLVSLDDLGIPDEVEETGETFHENAVLKATTYAALGGVLTLADDSGLEVDALGGEPGVRSARYGEQPPTASSAKEQSPDPPLSKETLPIPPFGKGGLGGISDPVQERMSDRDRVALLLRNLEEVPWERRTARFRCVIAISTPATPERRGNIKAPKDLALMVGSVTGMIQYKPLGAEGFGYDPVFYLPSYQLTMAQLALTEKNRISHRADAARKAVALLRGTN